jgi:hypothetical protein
LSGKKVTPPPCGKKDTMATKKSPTSSTSTKKPSPTVANATPAPKKKVVASVVTPTKTTVKAPPIAAKAAPKKPAVRAAAAAASTSPATAKLAERLRRCPEAREVKVPEERGIAVRLKTRQLELPMLVHLPVDDDGLVVFDVYPFRFVGIDAQNTDWLSMIRLAGGGYVQLRLDQDFEDKDVLVYSFHMPLASLNDDVTATAVTTLVSFAEDNYDDVMTATGLVERPVVKH